MYYLAETVRTPARESGMLFFYQMREMNKNPFTEVPLFRILV